MSEQAFKEPASESKGSGVGILVILGIIFLPASILASLIYFIIFRKYRQRPHIAIIVSSFISLITIIYALISGAFTRVKDVFLDITNILNTWTDLIPAYMVVNILIGCIAGCITILLVVQQMKTSEYRTKLPGSWMYKFEYHRSPIGWLHRKKIIKDLKSGVLVDSEKAPLGLELNTADKDYVAYRYVDEAGKPTLINGAAGSGKTITLLSMILSDIINKIPTIVIDFKRSPELATKLAKWSKENGSEFYHFVNGKPENYDIPGSPGQAFYNPLKNGGASKPDMILNMREYDTAASVYKGNMRQLLQVLFNMMEKADVKKSPDIDREHGEIYEIESILRKSNFTQLASACIGTDVEENATEVDIASRNKTSNMRRAFDELGGQIRTIIASAYGPWIKTNNNGRDIDLYKLASSPGSVVLFSINADSEKDFAKFFGSLILADLSAVSAKRRNNGLKNPVNVYVDEFQAVPPDALTSLLEKSRESKVGMTLASQSLEQIIAASSSNGEAYLNSILDTCSNFIIHAGATENSATRFAEIIGKKRETVYKQSNQSESFFLSFNWANRRNHHVQTSEEERWRRDPSDFMSLSMPNTTNNYMSTTIMINKSPSDPRLLVNKGASSRMVHMIPNDEVIAEYYKTSMNDEEKSENVNLVIEDSSIEPLEAPLSLFEDDLDEDDDGGFVMETIDDNDSFVEDDEISFDDMFNNNDSVIKERDNLSSVHEAVSFDDLYKSNFSTKKKRPEPKKKDDDDMPLPDIDDL